LSLVAS
jgi:hypothetical protein